MIDQRRIDALRAAVANSPKDCETRLLLATALLSTDDVKNAYEQCLIALRELPDHVAGLHLAAECAAKLGDTTRSHSYNRLWKALVESDERDGSARSILARSAHHPSTTMDEDDADEFDDSPDVIPLRIISGGIRNEEVEHPKLRLANAKGMARVKALLSDDASEIRESLHNTGIKWSHDGLLMYGPPNCGKTFLARLLAGELNANFVSIDLKQVMEHWTRRGRRKLSEAFAVAQKHRPCVLLLDELDYMSPRNASTTSKPAITELANLLDDIAGREGTIVVATADRPWELDAALVQPGRLGKVLLVLPPDPPARSAILRKNLEGVQLEPDIDLQWAVIHTEGYSGEDLRIFCAKAIQHATDTADSQELVVKPLSTADLKHAREETRPSAAAWLNAAGHRAMLASDSGLYDDLLIYLGRRTKS